MKTANPLILSLPAPRTLDLIFRPDALDRLRRDYEIVEADTLPAIPDEDLQRARYIIGQPDMSEADLARMPGLRCIFIAHNIHHVFQVVDRIVVMRRGTIAADDLSPRTSSIQEVEDIITGEHLAA